MQQDGTWLVGASGGARVLRIVDRDPFGVLGHVVQLPSGELSIPMRAVANGDGTGILSTVFRAPGMSDEAFAADTAQVARDRHRLEAIPQDDASVGS